MKISKNLLKSIAVGVALTATTTSCEFMDTLGEMTDGETQEQTIDENGVLRNLVGTMRCLDDCPGCGMG